MRLNESRCQKSTATNEFAFSALNPHLYFYNRLLIQMDMTIFGSNNIVLERQSFQTVPGLSWFSDNDRCTVCSVRMLTSREFQRNMQTRTDKI